MNIITDQIGNFQPYYQDADCVIYNADCRQVLPLLGPNEPTFDALITDPPYGIIGKFGHSDLYGSRSMQFEFDQPVDVIDIVCEAIGLASSLSNSIHVFCDPDHYGRIAAVVRKIGHTVKPWARLKKCPPPPMPGNWWPSAFELAMYGYKSGAFFGDCSGKRKNTYECDSYRHGIRKHEKVDHPTQKWLPMICYLVTTLVPESGLC